MTTQETRELIERLIRLETRLAQLMLHMGLDPHTRKYDKPRTTADRN